MRVVTRGACILHLEHKNNGLRKKNNIFACPLFEG